MVANTPKIQPVHSWTDPVFLPQGPAGATFVCQDTAVTQFVNNNKFESSETAFVSLYLAPQSSCNTGMDPILTSRSTLTPFSPAIPQQVGQAPETAVAFGLHIINNWTSGTSGFWKTLVDAVDTSVNEIADTSEKAAAVEALHKNPAYQIAKMFADLEQTSDIYYETYGERLSTVMANTKTAHFASEAAAQRELFMAEIDNTDGGMIALDFWRDVNELDALANNQYARTNARNEMQLAGSSLDHIMDYAEGKRDELKNSLPEGWRIRNGKLERPGQPTISLADYFNKEIWAEYAATNGITIADANNPLQSIVAEAATAIETARGLASDMIKDEEFIKDQLAMGKTMEELDWEWHYLPVYWLMQVRDGDFGRMLAGQVTPTSSGGRVRVDNGNQDTRPCCSGYDPTTVQMGLVNCKPGC